MTLEAKSEALKAIHDIVLSLMNETDRSELDYGLSLIESICRHGNDVRSIQDSKKYSAEG